MFLGFPEDLDPQVDAVDRDGWLAHGSLTRDLDNSIDIAATVSGTNLRNRCLIG